MNMTNLITLIISLAIAAALFALGINAFAHELGNTTVRLYPSAFFALVAAVQILQYIVPKRSK